MRRFLVLALVMIPVCVNAVTEAPAVKWSDEGSSASVVAPTIQNRDFQRVRIDDLISYIRYLFEPKQAILLPEGTDPFFFFAYNDNAAHVSTAIFNESELLNSVAWIRQDVVTWSGTGTLRYVCPSAHYYNSTWFPQVTYNCYGPPSYEGYLYDEGGITAGLWTTSFAVNGPVFDYYLPLTDTGPGNVVFMEGQARDVAEDSHIFKSFDAVDATMINPPGEVMIFPSDVNYGPNPVYGQGYENSQLVYHDGTIVICLGGYRTDSYSDPNNPLLPVFRTSTDGGVTWSDNTWLDQAVVTELPGSIPGIQGHYRNSFFDMVFDGDGHMHFLAVIADSGYYYNDMAYIHGLYDIRQTDAGWTASPVSDGIYPDLNPRELLGGDSWMHSPSLAWGENGTIVAAWNDIAVIDWSDTTAYSGIWASFSYDHGETWSDPIRVAGEIGVDEYYSRLVPTTSYVAGADSGYAYILTMPTGGADGPLDMIRIPYPAVQSISVTAELVDGQLQLTWTPVAHASAYWVYAAVNQTWFVPGLAPGYEHLLAIVAAPATTWSWSVGVGNPDENWTYLVMAATEYEQVLAVSNRVGEQDYEADTP